MMKKLWTLMALLAVASLPARAVDNWTTVTASHIQDASGTTVASGQLCFQGTDVNSKPIPFQAGGGIVIKTPACRTITNGAVVSFRVPNPAQTSPVGIFYTVTITPTGQSSTILRKVQWSGGTFNFDMYSPAGETVIPPSGGTVVGSLTVIGDFSVTGTFMGAFGGDFNGTVTDRGGEVHNVKAYGAWCDGHTDDTAAIQSTIDNAVANGNTITNPQGGVVVIPEGCVISSTINVTGILRGVGWGLTNATGATSYLKWVGPAGVPMVQIQNYGSGIENLRFVGNAFYKPSEAILLNRTTGTANSGFIRDVYIGGPFGNESSTGPQFTNGITWSGSVGNDSWAVDNLHLYQISGNAINITNGNASDIHFNNLFVSLAGVGFYDVASGIEGTNWLFTLNTIDIDVVDPSQLRQPKIYIKDFVSENSGQFIVGGSCNVYIEGGSWAAGSNIISSGIIIDQSAAHNNQYIVSLKNFIFVQSQPAGIVLTWNIAPSTGNNLGIQADCDHCFGVDSSFMVYNPSGATQDARNGVQINFNTGAYYGSPGLNAHEYNAPYEPFDAWRYDFQSKVNVFGGPLTVGALSTPTGVAPIATGTGATVYGYRVTAVSGAGETLSSTEGTAINSASLNPTTNYNTVWWFPTRGADHYNIYGRTSGAELFMVTVPADITGGRGHWVDDGSITPSGAMPTINTTGRIISTAGTGTPPFVVASTTPVANLAATPTTYSAAGTQQANIHLVKDTCTLGTNCSITFSGSAVFASTTSYDCWARDATTPGNAVTVTRTSGSSLAFTGTGTDVINFVCAGN